MRNMSWFEKMKTTYHRCLLNIMDHTRFYNGKKKHMFWILKTKLILFQLTDWFLFNYVKIDWKGDVVPIPLDSKEVLVLYLLVIII